MLVLTRRAGESILAGDLEIIVLGVEGNRIRLGFNGGSGYRIQRKEVADKKNQSDRTINNPLDVGENKRD